MREVDERRLQGQLDQGALAGAAQEETPAADRTRFSSQGAIPPVAADEKTLKPSASDLAYNDTDIAHAPPKDGDAKKDAKAAPAKAPDTTAWPQLLKDFGAKFPAAAALIAAQPSSCKFVKDSEAGGAKFGGFAEDGPGKDAWPYTSGDTVYIPKAHTDPLTAMSDFLFELNNAVRYPKFQAIHVEGRKGSKGTLTAKTYARKKVELEVEGMLQLGEVWLATKKEAGKEKDKTWAAHDSEFYLAQYEAYKAGKLTKADIVDRVLKSKYTEGDDAGKTVEEVYSKQYEDNALEAP